jgi:flagellar hook-length control protein FliK
MQNTTLPIQVAPTANAPAPSRANVQPASDGPAFSQTLNREMAQRQARPIDKTPATPAAPIKVGPGQTAAQAPAAPTGPVKAAKHIATVDNAADDATDPAAVDATATADVPLDDASTTLAVAADPALTSADATAAAAAAEQGAAAAAPMSDMLAMVASYKQLLQGGSHAAKPAVADDATAATKTVRGTSVAEDTHTLAALQGALKKTDGADTGKATAAPAQAGDGTATPAVKSAVPDLATIAGKAAPQSDAAMSTLRDTAATATVKDTAPVTGSAFQAQLSSVEMAQTAVTPASNTIPARLGTTAWDTQVSQKVVWMVGGADQTASLTLNPPDLGPVQVVLNVNNDQATVAFSSATPEVREALENAMPRLREMLSDAGVTLGDASVNANMPDQRQADTSQGSNSRHGGGTGGGNGNGNGVRSGETEIPLPRTASRAARDDSVVDTFA